MPIDPYSETTWTSVDELIAEKLLGHDAALEEALRASNAAGLPQIAVSPAQGKLLYLLARIGGAKRILEIGTLGGYSTIWLAQALPPSGRLVTLEADPKHAEVARANLDRAGLGRVTEVVMGPALETLARLEREGEEPFDLVFIDADKQSTPDYFYWALRFTRSGSVIVVDNVVREGAILDPEDQDPSVEGIRRFYELARGDARVDATAIQTVGVKGYDGFAIVLVT